ERDNGRFGHGGISFLCEIDGVFQHRHDMPPTSGHHQLSGITRRARYPVWTKPVLTSLEQHYRIWRVHQEQPDLNYIQLADAVGVMRAYEDNLETRNKKSAVASRMIKQAKFMIDQAVHGRFPVMNQKQLDAGMGKFPQIPPSGLPDEEASRRAILATIDDMFEDDPAKAAEMKAALFPELYGDK
ncbi:hypothetical protein, partial [Salibaculum griseiflavum]|uniref:hypothetical protein n=1 Tax=Salibaculum griseiflavum TaxID=1914409 RepID=UPI001C388B55